MQDIALAKSQEFSPAVFSKNRIILCGGDLRDLHLKTNSDPSSSIPIQQIEQQAKTRYAVATLAAIKAGIKDIAIDLSEIVYRMELKTVREAHAAYLDEWIEQKDLIWRMIMDDRMVPLNVVLGIAELSGVRVHAVNTDVSGLATVFRMTARQSTEPYDADNPNRAFEVYMQRYYRHDYTVFESIVGTKTAVEFEDALQELMRRRYGPNGQAIEAAMVSEAGTLTLIDREIGDRSFIGFFMRNVCCLVRIKQLLWAWVSMMPFVLGEASKRSSA